MGKASNKIIKKKDNKNVLGIAIFLLVIMVLSVAGFALSGSRSHTGSSGNTPNEVPFQEFQDKNTGRPFWGAIRGGEQFIFLNISGFSQREDMAELAFNIKQQEIISIYKTNGFNDSSADFLIRKALKGLRIDTNDIYNLDCSKPTLVLGTVKEDNNCLYFLAEGDNTYNKANALVYYLVQK